MQRIFEDERRISGPNRPYPFGTGALSTLICVGKSLKWGTLLRFPRLARVEMASRQLNNVTIHRTYDE